jgi:hypothetical protein
MMFGAGCDGQKGKATYLNHVDECINVIKVGAPQFHDQGVSCGVHYGPYSGYGGGKDYIDHSRGVRISGDIVNPERKGKYVIEYTCDPQDSEGFVYEHMTYTRTVYVGMQPQKWCKYTKNGDETWDWRENRRAGDVHARRMAKGKDGEEKCRAKCNELGDDKCYAFVYHKFGNCKFITKKSYGDEIDHCKRRQKSCIMNSGKGSLFHKC